MPFPMKIQPIDSQTQQGQILNDPVKPVVKSRLKRLFERQFTSALKISSSDKPGAGEPHYIKDTATEFEPNSVCLDKMVQCFIEEDNDKQSAAARCGRNRCNCFNGNCNDSSDDEFDIFGSFSESINSASSGEACEILKSLVLCASTSERNLFADAAKIVEKNKSCKCKNDCRKIVAEGLQALGYDASLCKSRWEKSPSYPAGEYEYVDVIVEEERLLIDVDFRSEFEIARSTANYKAILQSLPTIFVGKSGRLQQIVSIVSEAARQSLKKKGMHFPPWRKAEYMRAKWLSCYTRTTSMKPNEIVKETETQNENKSGLNTGILSKQFELIFREKSSPAGMNTGDFEPSPTVIPGQKEKTAVVVSQWQPPAIKPKNSQRGAEIVTGLASVLNENS
ncbi:hypothetical protein HHK36_012722 [Tetracentron sinense]|uniref:Uncharacterized protein n=1 Tax=Tetracentron sinense TaxID=13715 RepID=A0A835DFY9_TETSI|nr:hypothetical protein HHK36_012722 [Tetracentron sinense]